MKILNCMSATLALSLSACATESDQSKASSDTGGSAIEAEKTAAMNEYAKCIRGAAQNLDDGSSDPSLIALAIQPDCKDQFARYVKIGGIGMDSRALAAYSERLEDNQTQLTAAIIQRMRSQQTRQN